MHPPVMVHCPSVGKLQELGATVAWASIWCRRLMAIWDRLTFPGVVLVEAGQATSMYNSKQGVVTTYPNNAGCAPAAVNSVAALWAVA